MNSNGPVDRGLARQTANTATKTLKETLTSAGRIKLSLPGKTFLVGEYVALAGGPSVLLSTEPRFELIVSLAEGAGFVAPQIFAPLSPAGKFIARHTEYFSGLELSFQDPHLGKGGLGASSAQFALLYALRFGNALSSAEKVDHRQMTQQAARHEQIDLTRSDVVSTALLSTDFDGQAWAALLDEYRACAWNGEGTPPSGADVVSQIHGGITWFDGRGFRARSLEWKFDDLSWTLMRTGVKLATHEHLALMSMPSLAKGPVADKAALHDVLRDCVRDVTTAFEEKAELKLIASVERCASALGQAGLTAPSTLRLLEDLHSERDFCLAAKGCGAMGADVVLVIHRKSEGRRLSEWIKARGLEVCGAESSLSGGLELSFLGFHR